MRIFSPEGTRERELKASDRPDRRGFALIAVLTITALLTLLVLALVTISSNATRLRRAERGQIEARQNARLAVDLALGELQRVAGADTRVTARADVLDEANPPVLGVWKSWEGSNHTQSGDFEGRPVSPGDYRAVKENRFVRWLTSSGGTSQPAIPDVKPGADKVALVGPGSVGTGTDRVAGQVHVPPTPVISSTQTGRVAWWIGGENQKARVQAPREPENDSVAGWAMLAKSHTVPDPESLGMKRLLDEPALADGLVRTGQVDLVADSTRPQVSRDHFHDLSTVSTGLLTNTATGGWRKDLSLLTENWNRLPKSNLPFFRVAPDRDISFSIPVRGGDYRSPRSLFYPWSDYRSRNIPIYEHGAVTSWENLKDWATLYKSMQSNGTRLAPRSYRIDSMDASENFDFLHTARVIPLIARFQWVFSHYGAKINDTAYEPRLLATPVVILWNPYNVTINTEPDLGFHLRGCLPNAFRFRVGDVQNQKWNSISPSTNHSPSLHGVQELKYKIQGSQQLRPGETMMFSPTQDPAPGSSELLMAPGFRPKTGHFFPLKKDDGSTFAVPSGTTVRVEAAFDAASNDGTNLGAATGVGIYLDMIIRGYRHLAYRMIYDQTVASAVYPTVNDLGSASVLEATTLPRPFLTTIFGIRTASRTHLAAKGLVQTSPLVNYTAMGTKDTVEYQIQWDYPGTAHPVNSPFDYSFEKLGSAGGDAYPNADSRNRGFIITGFQSADGLTRCVLADLPTKPLQSLAELQNWDMRYENPIPPYAFNIIGNSDASPLIPPDRVVHPGAPGTRLNLQHDDAYCANHLLFDDWFVSSIAPNANNLGRPPSSESMVRTFTDWVAGTRPLPNRAYRPLARDQGLAQTPTAITTLLNRSDAWRTMASRIEVDGMFNVNSTSVAAWRALLGHARKQKTPYFNASVVTELSPAQDFAFSRFPVAGDTEAKSRGTSGQFANCAEFAGYRILEDQALDRLAEEIVKQVRQRGPFLSLAEFINRQLSSGNLALAGAVQSALNALEKDASLNPFGVIQSGSKAATATPPASGSTGYAFPEAAVGYNAYGLPGWTRQADVLRPLAPVLSARDDTFVIRAYGDARDPTGKFITGRAVCEVVVRRVRDYVDPADAAETLGLPNAAANRIFGRRFETVSFRWLASDEI